jgi:hypothetical protein
VSARQVSPSHESKDHRITLKIHQDRQSKTQRVNQKLKSFRLARLKDKYSDKTVNNLSQYNLIKNKPRKPLARMCPLKHNYRKSIETTARNCAETMRRL